jgi:ribosome maturation factor RimP
VDDVSTFFVFGDMKLYRDIPGGLRELIEPIVADHGCELVDAETLGGQGAQVLRITIDTPECDGRVPVGRCEDVSREVETSLDATEAMRGRYRLEVTSPGLDRHLGREKDFVASVGRDLKLETRRPLDGRRRFRGRLLAFEENEVRMTVDGGEVAIPFDEVARANTVYEFSSADFGRGRSKPGAAS